MSLWKSDRVTIIAEIGSNHNGDFETACRLIDVAADAGADIVKFQSYLVDDLLEPASPHYETMKQLQLPKTWYPKLIDYAQQKGLLFLSTATNPTTMQWMEDYGVKGYKVASGNVSVYPLLDKLVDIGKPVILSTGMTTLDELLEIDARFTSSNVPHAFLHCVSKYPTPAKDMALKNISVLQALFHCPIGLSDHSEDVHMAVAAVALGARIVEKHISLDKQGLGLDHEVAVLPDRFKRMCTLIRDTETALHANFILDKKLCFQYRRSIRFTRDLDVGSVLKAGDLKITRPEDGLHPKYFDALIGRKLVDAVSRDTPTCWEQFGE
ncbi:MAG: N-acetylneuraminate synthase family protein [Gammaproteobacteria bacterium]|nr:N-acetylneuraminate synthase family protein [Gammaproteobacteria bacterium]HXK55006.1 N-acetylneuraminate synthase family protein [Gammaproteobacteria bacterium]